MKRARSEVNHWLMKSEPHKFSLDDLKKMKVSPWDGVRNYAARNHMRNMRVGDRVLFYHSNCKEPGVAGTATVVKEAYDDHTALDPKSDYYSAKATAENNPWQMVDVQFEAAFTHPVLLKDMKVDKELSAMVLFKQSRLSVQPVTAAEFDHVESLGLVDTRDTKGKDD